MKRSRKILHLAILTTAFLVARTSAEEPPPTEAQLRAWVSELGSDDFHGRQAAETALLKAPAKDVMPLLKVAVRSEDPEVQARARRLLEVLGWTLRPDFTEPADVVPEDTMLLFWVPQADTSVSVLAKSGFGTLLRDPKLAPFWKGVLSLHGEEDGHLTYEQDAQRRLLKRWRTEFTGCWAWGLLAPTPDENKRTVSLFSTRHPEPEKSLRLLRDAGEMGEDAVEDEWLRGIHIRGFEHGCAGAVVKNLTVVADSKPILKQVINLAARPENGVPLSATPWFQAAQHALPEKPLLAFGLNMPPLLDALDEVERSLLRKMGFGAWRWCSAALQEKDGLLHECMTVRIEGNRQGWSKALNFRAHEPHLAALCPPNALAFVSVPLEGTGSLDSGLELYEVFRDDEVLAGLIRKAVKDAHFAEALAPLKEEAAAWVLPPRNPETSLVPVLQAIVQAPGDEEAKRAADALAALIRTASDMKELVSEKTLGERTIYVFDLKRLDQEADFQPAWTTVGAKLVFGAEERALDDLIKRLTAAPAPAGLDSSEDYKRMLAAVPVAERGLLAYQNPKAVEHAYGGKTRAAFDHDYPEMAKLLPDGELLADLPGTIASISGTNEGLRYHAAGGLPPLGQLAIFLTAVTVTLHVR